MTSKSLGSQRPQDVERTSEDVIREWVARFATNCGQPLSEARVLLWIDELSDIEPQRLELVFRAVMHAHSFNSIPQIGEIRALITKADAKGFELRAERAWEWALEVAQRCYFADLGGLRYAPPIPAEIEFAVKACGGWRRLHACAEDELVWCRKTFIERYTTIHETRQVEHLLTSDEAKKILSSLTTEAQSQRALAAPPTVRQASLPHPNTDDGIGAAFEEARRVVNAPRTMPLLSPDEIDRRKHEQRARLERHLQEHPELRGNVASPEGCELVLTPSEVNHAHGI